jgi:predicted class III extradiol MEMO1 family dioxygenase
MSVIESQEQFEAYRREYKKTICGRYPISVLLQALSQSQVAFDLRFKHYAQSGQVTSAKDS